MEGAVRAIKQEDVHRICSGQVIVSLCSAVKELIENSLDAKPRTRVEVRLNNHGFDSFEVIDDASGIAEQDRASVCLKHFTSKLASFEDLKQVQTFGFRGEALSSLCDTAGSVTITTKCEDEAQGVKLQYDRNGMLVSTTPVARGETGTSVLVKSLFAFLPVRKLDFERKLKKHYTDLLLLLQAYAVITQPGIKFSVTNVVKSVRSNVISTPGNTITANLASVFGSAFLQDLVPIEFDFMLAFGGATNRKTDWFADRDRCNEEEHEELHQVRFTGFVSKPSGGSNRGNNADRQFFYMNGRPVEMKRFVKAANEVWKQQANLDSSKPACMVNVIMPLNGSFDVNLSPDKREIFISKELEIVERFKDFLCELWIPSHSRVFEHLQEMNSSQYSSNAVATPLPVEETPTTQGNDDFEDVAFQQSTVEEEEEEPKHQPESKHSRVVVSDRKEEEEPTQQRESKRSRLVPDEGEEEEPKRQPKSKQSHVVVSEEERHPVTLQHVPRTTAAVTSLPVTKLKQSSILDYVFNANKPKQDAAVIEKEEGAPSSPPIHSCCDHDHPSPPPPPPPPIAPIEADETSRTSVEHVGTTTVGINFGSAQDLLQAEREWEQQQRKTTPPPTTANLFSNANVDQQQPQAEEQVEQVLERTFLKSYFKQAEIIGQFNLGFIIARIANDLFIFDQHASDEKFRFETLQQSTTIHEQPLITPLVLDASAVERQTIRDFEYVFNANGFRFTTDEALKLTTVPHSKQTLFGVCDVRELAVLLRENPPTAGSSAALLRPSRLRAMFASRACRSAVMIGDALTPQQMAKIVSNLESLQQPWNCPHGRPTLRHLMHLPNLT